MAIVTWPGYYFDGMNRYSGENGGNISVSGIGNITQAWAFTGGAAFAASPIFGAGVPLANLVMIGCQDSKFYAVDSATGLESWHATLGGQINAAAYYDHASQRVYVPCDDHKLYKLNATSGAQVWACTVPTDKVQAAPWRVGSLIYTGANDSKVYAINDADGSVAWSYPTGGAIIGAVAYYSGDVFACSADGYCYRLNGTTGALVRTFRARASITTPPCLATDSFGLTHLMFGSSDHYFYNYNPNTGARIWQDWQRGDLAAGACIDAVTGLVILGTHDWNTEVHNLYHGQTVWIKSASGPGNTAISSCAAAANGVFFVGWNSPDNRFVGFKTDQSVGGHNPNVQFTLGNSIGPSSPISTASATFVGCKDGTLRKFA